MAWLTPSFAGIPNFLLYAAIGATLAFIFVVVYVRITGHDEIALIRQGNASAAVALGGSMIGFAMPLSKAIAQAASVPDCIVWGMLALVVQLSAYFATRLFVPDLSRRIEDNMLAAALILAAVSIMAGQLNAAAMTYTPGLGGIVEAL